MYKELYEENNFFPCLAIFSNASISETLKAGYHLNESEKAKILISSVNELLASNPEADIKVVIHSTAVVRLAKMDNQRSNFEGRLNKGIDIGASSTSMLKNKVMPSIVINGVEFLA